MDPPQDPSTLKDHLRLKLLTRSFLQHDIAELTVIHAEICEEFFEQPEDAEPDQEETIDEGSVADLGYFENASDEEIQAEIDRLEREVRELEERKREMDRLVERLKESLGRLEKGERSWPE